MTNVTPEIRVICRVLAKDEKDDKTKQSKPNNENSIEIIDSRTVRIPVVTVKGRSESDAPSKKEFTVHEVLSSPTVSTERVYSSFIAPNAIQGALAQGRPATLLSYGAEKTGKSWSIYGSTQLVQVWDGSATEVGMVSRTIHDIFQYFETQKRNETGTTYALQVAMMMVLKTDTLHDLLLDNRERDIEFTVRNAKEADPQLDVESNLSDTGRLFRDAPVSVGGGMVVSGLSYLLCGNKMQVCETINAGLKASRDIKGDRVTILNVVKKTTPPTSTTSTSLSFTPIIVIDCSPVYSKSMHNLRDIANCMANRHKNAEHMKSNLTRLLAWSFSGPCTLRLVVHCKVSSFDLDLFDSLSSLNFSALVMKIHRNLTALPPAGQDTSNPPATTTFYNTYPPRTPSPPKITSLSSSAPTPTPPSHTAKPPSPNTPSGVVRTGISPTRPPLVRPANNSPERQGHSPHQGEDGSSRTAAATSEIMQKHVQSLIAQLKEKDEHYRKALDSIDQVSMLLQQERDKTKRLEDQLGQSTKRKKELETQLSHIAIPPAAGAEEEEGDCRSTDDQAAFVTMSEDQENTLLKTGLGGTATAILSPCRPTTPPGCRQSGRPSPPGTAPENEAISASPKGMRNTSPTPGGSRQKSPIPPSGNKATRPRGGVSPVGTVNEGSSDIPQVTTQPPSPSAASAARDVPTEGADPSVEVHSGEVEDNSDDTDDTDSEVENSLSGSSSEGEDLPEIEDVDLQADSSSDTDRSGTPSESQAPSRGSSVEDGQRLSGNFVTSCTQREYSKMTRQLKRMTERFQRARTKNKKYKKLTKSLTAQLNHQAYLASHYGVKLEEEERKCQEHIAKTIALSTRLEETKKWVRKLKKAVLAEKEKSLPMFNDGLKESIEVRKREEIRQEEYRIKCDKFLEQEKALTHELQIKCDKIDSMEAMIQALGAEYNRKLQTMMQQSPEWEALTSSVSSVQGDEGWPVQTLAQAWETSAEANSSEAPDIEHIAERLEQGDYMNVIQLQLKADNEVLRSNMQGVMQVVEHCYEENSRLSNLTAKLTRSLAEANEQIQVLKGVGSGDELVGDIQFQLREKSYLKNIADLQFALFRSNNQVQGFEQMEEGQDEDEEEQELQDREIVMQQQNAIMAAHQHMEEHIPPSTHPNPRQMLIDREADLRERDRDTRETNVGSGMSSHSNIPLSTSNSDSYQQYTSNYPTPPVASPSMGIAAPTPPAQPSGIPTMPPSGPPALSPQMNLLQATDETPTRGTVAVTEVQ